jgi:hypothetical protein
MGTFGDGSNKWIDGTIETLQNPVDRLSNPYDTAAGAADAAALNFDEGVGGLSSFFDSEPGNTAGPGQEAAFDLDGDGSAEFGAVGGRLATLAVIGVVLIIAAQSFGSGLAEGLTG